MKRAAAAPPNGGNDRRKKSGAAKTGTRMNRNFGEKFFRRRRSAEAGTIACPVKDSGISQVAISDMVLGFLRFRTALKHLTDTKSGQKPEPEPDCLKRILCEMNAVVSGRKEDAENPARLFSEFGTLALLQNQNVLAPTEGLLRAARTGRHLAEGGRCRRVYTSCSSWQQITNEAELLWLPTH